MDASVLKKMLPMLAMIVAGYMAKQRVTSASPDSGAGLGGMLGGLLGGGQSGGASAGGLGGLLGMGNQRNPLDEILGKLGR